MPVDSFLRFRTTFKNLIFYPWTNFYDFGQIFKLDFVARGQFFGNFGRLLACSFSPVDTSSDENLPADNMGLWQLGRTEVIEH